MEVTLNAPDPWTQTISEIKRFFGEKSVPNTGIQDRRANNEQSRPRGRIPRYKEKNLNLRWPRFNERTQPALVLVLERPTKTTALVCWSDASLCHYGYQMWRAVKSQTAGMFAFWSTNKEGRFRLQAFDQIGNATERVRDDFVYSDAILRAAVDFFSQSCLGRSLTC